MSDSIDQTEECLLAEACANDWAKVLDELSLILQTQDPGTSEHFKVPTAPRRRFR